MCTDAHVALVMLDLCQQHAVVMMTAALRYQIRHIIHLRCSQDQRATKETVATTAMMEHAVGAVLDDIKTFLAVGLYSLRLCYFYVVATASADVVVGRAPQ